ncbi:ARM repeat superfamily protein [Pelomyxa schiedti]|nr:ARM repeat superfamily protein [Pelomyxa schiedti]
MRSRVDTGRQSQQPGSSSGSTTTTATSTTTTIATTSTTSGGGGGGGSSGGGGVLGGGAKRSSRRGAPGPVAVATESSSPPRTSSSSSGGGGGADGNRKRKPQGPHTLVSPDQLLPEGVDDSPVFAMSSSPSSSSSSSSYSSSSSPGSSAPPPPKKYRGASASASASAGAMEGGGGGGSDGGLGDKPLDHDEILKLIDEAPEIEALDKNTMRKMVLTLEKKINKATDTRAKYPDQEEKFIQDEIELAEEVRKLQVLATAPALYADFVQIGAPTSLLSLLSHENTELVADVIELLHELIDPDIVAESREAKSLVDNVLENHMLELLVQNVKRFKFGDDDNTINLTLEIFENIMEINPSTSETLGKETEVFQYLLGLLNQPGFGPIKLYGCELMSILLHNSENNIPRVGALNGIDALLVSIAEYRAKDPATAEEQEYLENSFNCICALLTDAKNQQTFDTVGQGLHLMIKLIKAKKSARRGALRVVDYQLQNNATSCKNFIEIGGLSTWFAAFMKKGVKKPVHGNAERQDDEHILGAIVSMFRYIEPASPLFSRLLAKFAENSFEKVDRLVELYMKYDATYREAVRTLEVNTKELLKTATPDEAEEIGAQLQMEKLDSGLFILQNICLVMSFLCTYEPTAKEHLKGVIRLRGITPDSLREVLQGYIDSLPADSPFTQFLHNKSLPSFL